MAAIVRSIWCMPGHCESARPARSSSDIESAAKEFTGKGVHWHDCLDCLLDQGAASRQQVTRCNSSACSIWCMRGRVMFMRNKEQGRKPDVRYAAYDGLGSSRPWLKLEASSPTACITCCNNP